MENLCSFHNLPFLFICVENSCFSQLCIKCINIHHISHPNECPNINLISDYLSERKENIEEIYLNCQKIDLNAMQIILDSFWNYLQRIFVDFKYQFQKQFDHQLKNVNLRQIKEVNEYFQKMKVGFTNAKSLKPKHLKEIHYFSIDKLITDLNLPISQFLSNSNEKFKSIEDQLKILGKDFIDSLVVITNNENNEHYFEIEKIISPSLKVPSPKIEEKQEKEEIKRTEAKEPEKIIEAPEYLEQIEEEKSEKEESNETPDDLLITTCNLAIENFEYNSLLNFIPEQKPIFLYDFNLPFHQETLKEGVNLVLGRWNEKKKVSKVKDSNNDFFILEGTDFTKNIGKYNLIDLDGQEKEGIIDINKQNIFIQKDHFAIEYEKSLKILRIIDVRTGARVFFNFPYEFLNSERIDFEMEKFMDYVSKNNENLFISPELEIFFFENCLGYDFIFFLPQKKELLIKPMRTLENLDFAYHRKAKESNNFYLEDETSILKKVLFNDKVKIKRTERVTSNFDVIQIMNNSGEISTLNNLENYEIIIYKLSIVSATKLTSIYFTSLHLLIISFRESSSPKLLENYSNETVNIFRLLNYFATLECNNFSENSFTIHNFQIYILEDLSSFYLNLANQTRFIFHKQIFNPEISDKFLKFVDLYRRNEDMNQKDVFFKNFGSLQFLLIKDDKFNLFKRINNMMGNEEKNEEDQYELLVRWNDNTVSSFCFQIGEKKKKNLFGVKEGVVVREREKRKERKEFKIEGSEM